MIEAKLAKVKKELNDKELQSLEDYREMALPQLSAVLQAQFFELFLTGTTCQDIQKLNPQYHLGQIIAARVSGDWDDLRKEYQETLFKGIKERVQQSQMEVVSLLSDMLAAANKMHSKKLKKFLQTGDERELGNLRIDSVRSLKEVVSLLLMTTGQDNTKRIQGSVELFHTGEVKTDNESVKKALDSESVSAILKMLDGHDTEE